MNTWKRTLACSLLLWSSGCTCGGEEKRALPPAPVTLEADRISAAPTVDGHVHEQAWLQTARTHRFADAQSGADGLPYTEARALCDPEALDLAIYCGDEDLRGRDRVGVVLTLPDQGVKVLEVDPTGRTRWHGPGGTAGAPPDGIQVGVDSDGTVDAAGGNDEEWIAEIRIPWSLLGLDGPGEVRANFFRRDQPLGSTLRQLAWSPWRDAPTSDQRVLGAIHCADPAGS